MKAEDLTDEWIMGQTQAPMVLSGHRRLAETAFKAGQKEVMDWLILHKRSYYAKPDGTIISITSAEWTEEEWESLLKEKEV